MSRAMDSDSNQRKLVAEIDRLLAALTGEEAPDREPPDEQMSRLELLAARLGLSQFENDLVALCAGVELHGPAAEAIAKLNGDSARPFLNFSLALSQLEESHWSAISPGGPLRHFGVLDVHGSGPLVQRDLHIAERVLHHLVGVDYLDPFCEAFLTRLAPQMYLADAHHARSLEVAAVLNRPNVVAQIVGRHRSDRHGVAVTTCHALGQEAFLLSLTDLPTNSSDRSAFFSAWQRESVLSGGVLVVDVEGVSNQLREQLLPGLHVSIPNLIVSGSTEVHLGGPSVRIDVDPLTAPERAVLYADLMGGTPDDYQREADQFVLSVDQMVAAAEETRLVDSPDENALWEAAKQQARPTLDGLATRAKSSATWEDLVLPQLQISQIEDLADRLKHRSNVYDGWGFAAQSSRGLGVTALFSGPSGTGKTFAAEVIGNHLGLDVYKVDLSAAVSKYIGETEKNLGKVFDAAEAGGAILFFDECDALFGKRSEVRDSHDRYANIEVSYLLQRIEDFHGLAILATNDDDAIDDSFTRRLTAIVRFPFPNSEGRKRIWQQTLAMAPTESINWTALASYELSGGMIRSVAIDLAFRSIRDGAADLMPRLDEAIAAHARQVGAVIGRERGP